ncbi:Kelch-like protein 6 [Branchiostoma belcheri]|nr:Kelch-like protein 6 [Branchiostoma belcheri]
MSMDILMGRASEIPGVEEDCYAAWFFRQLQEFRTDGHLVDVTLCAEGREIPCHRLVLSACTDYFHAMFSGSHPESSRDKIEMLGVNGDALEMLVGYAYTSIIHITADNIQPLFEAANMLQVKPVENDCEKFLKDHLGPGTCLSTWALADKLSCTHLSAMARSYALKNFEDVCGTEEFLQLPVDFLKTYVSDDGLHAMREERVLEAIILWVMHDLDERQRHLEEALACVHFSHLNQGLLENIVETDPVLSEVLGIEELIRDECRRARPPRHIHQEEMIVLGGFTCADRPDAGAENFKTHANFSMYRLNLHCDTIDCKPMSRPLHRIAHSAVCVVNNDIILTGGGKSPRQAFRYSVLQNSWTRLPWMRKGRGMHGMAAMNGKVYVVGGQDPYDMDRKLSSVEVYNEQTKSWKRVKSMRRGVSNFGIAAYGGKVYVFGGDLDSRTTSKVQCYEPDQNEWTVKATRLPEPESGIRACTVNSMIYLVGGSLDCVLRYNPQLDRYEERAKPLKSWEHCSACVCGSEIYITGGLSKLFLDYLNIPHPRVQCYDVSSDTMCMGSLEGLPVPLCAHHTVTVARQ